MIWYLAYGSNLQSATLRGRRGVDYRRAVPVRAPGWRLVFDKPPLIPAGNAVANIVPEPGAEVLGVAFAISEDELAHIERTEGVFLDNYRRVEVAVAALAEVLDPPTLAFSLSSERRDPTALPSFRYMAMVIEGALEHGLPETHVAWLRGIPACEESPELVALRPKLDEFFKRR